MSTKTKGRRGYTKHGYPIVWKRHARKKISTEGKSDAQIEAEIHAICMANLTGSEPDPSSVTSAQNKPSSAPKGAAALNSPSPSNLEYTISADSHCLHLNFSGKTTYHATIQDLTDSLYKQLVIKKVRNRGLIKDLSSLKEIAISSRNEVLRSVENES